MLSVSGARANKERQIKEKSRLIGGAFSFLDNGSLVLQSHGG